MASPEQREKFQVAGEGCFLRKRHLSLIRPKTSRRQIERSVGTPNWPSDTRGFDREI
jgi:hypothetical protein